MKWVLLIIAGLFETGFATCLGKAQSVSGRESLLWWLGFVICLFSSMYLMFRAISGVGAIPIGDSLCSMDRDRSRRWSSDGNLGI